MKVVAVDNYARDTVSDKLIKENVSEEEGKAICKEHNDKLNDTGSERWYILKADNYELYKFDPT